MHDVPTNYVPYEIYFRVQHVSVAGESRHTALQGCTCHADSTQIISQVQSPPDTSQMKVKLGLMPISFHDRIGS